MATIDEAIARLESLAASPLDGVKTDVADGGKRVINDGFMSSVDPYGVTWAPLKRHGGPRVGGPLRKTDAMRQSVEADPTSTGVRYSVGGPSVFHQEGTRTIPVRSMLPTASRGLPRGWSVMVSDSFARRMRERVVGG